MESKIKMIDYAIELENTIPDAKDLNEFYHMVLARKDAKELFEEKIYPSLVEGKNFALKIFGYPIKSNGKDAARLFSLQDYLQDHGYKVTLGEKWKTQKDIQNCSLEYISIKVEWEA